LQSLAIDRTVCRASTIQSLAIVVCHIVHNIDHQHELVPNIVDYHILTIVKHHIDDNNYRYYHLWLNDTVDMVLSVVVVVMVQRSMS
jgi:hypothetical protein